MSNAQENKVREFFVYEIPSEADGKPHLRVIRTKKESAFNDDWIAIHCVEHSAYLALQAENEKLKDANKKLEKANALIDELEKTIKYYSLKSNYSLVDEGRNYNVEYKCYELNEDTYADEELGMRASQALEKIKQYKESGK